MSLVMNVKIIVPSFVLLFSSSFLYLKGKGFFFPGMIFLPTASAYSEEDESTSRNSTSSISDPL